MFFFVKSKSIDIITARTVLSPDDDNENGYW